LFFVALFARQLITYPPNWEPLGYGRPATYLKPSFNPPAYAPENNPHYFGTDDIGHDLFSQLVWGSRVTIIVGFISGFVALVLGVLVGGVAGYFRGKIDHILMRITDILLTLPFLPFLLVIVAVVWARTQQPPSIFITMVGIGFLSFPGMARLVRSEILSLRDREFVEAARAIGVEDNRILFKHILPNALPPVMINLTLTIATAILLEAALSFLGFGDPTVVTWGRVLTEAQDKIFVWNKYWWWVIPPGFLILLVVAAFNLVGNGLTDAMNPKLRELT
jgi:peptide/nickel transport system permease protein